MSKAVEEFKKLMESERGERQKYESAAPSDTIRVPITRDGFEAFLEISCKLMDLPVTNPLRNVLIGFFHHIENSTCDTTLQAAGAALHKSMSNQCTWEIDQEVKKVANAELEEERQKLRDATAAVEVEKKIKAAEEKRAAKTAKKSGKTLPVVAETAPNEERV